MQALHRIILQVMPACKSWFLDGKNSEDKKPGKASVSGYCIGLKTIKDVNNDILQAAIRYGVGAQNEKTELMK